MLYPLKFHPILKPTIWGGHRLANKSHSPSPSQSIGESWEISAIQDRISVVSNGFLADNNLQELIEVYMGDLVGDHVYEQFGLEFPLLIKYIDANANLSIQVHPDDTHAKERHRAYGKTEMWYVIDTQEEASLILGFNKPMDPSEYLKKLNEQHLLDILHVEPARKDDCFFIPSGLIHSIGQGCYLAEIQQTSDVTYRIYDYNRTGEDGQPRELHTELATEVIDYTYHPTHRVNYQKMPNTPVQLVRCPYFTAHLLEFDKNIERDYMAIDSFVVYMCISGKFTITTGQCPPVEVAQGETVLIPALLKNLTLYPDEVTKILEIYIK